MTTAEKKYSIDEVFNMIGEEHLSGDTDKDKRKYDIMVDGFKVRPISLRYKTFYQKGTKCVCCGKEGTHFKLCGDERRPKRRHFNLYADDGTLMTKDHIIPRARGGMDQVSNMQTMCEDCNKAKGASCPGFTQIIATNKKGNQVFFTTIEKAAYHVAMNMRKASSPKMKRHEAVKIGIECMTEIQSAIKSKTEYQGYYWEEKE